MSLCALQRLFHVCLFQGAASRRALSSFTFVDDIQFDENMIQEKLKTLGAGDITLKTLEGSRKGGALISLVNPDHKNALTGSMMVKLAEIVDELESWKDGKALILHGVKGTFCSGADLSVARVLHTSEDGGQMCALMQKTLTRLRRLLLISVAVIEGKALGRGAEVRSLFWSRWSS